MPHRDPDERRNDTSGGSSMQNGPVFRPPWILMCSRVCKWAWECSSCRMVTRIDEPEVSQYPAFSLLATCPFFCRGRIIVVDFFLRDLSGVARDFINPLSFSYPMHRMHRSECFVCFEMEFCKMKSTRDFSFFFSFFNKKMRRFLLDEILRIEFRGSLVFQCSIKFVLFLFIQDWNLDDSKSKILENEIKILVKISTVRFR